MIKHFISFFSCQNLYYHVISNILNYIWWGSKLACPPTLAVSTLLQDHRSNPRALKITIIIIHIVQKVLEAKEKKQQTEIDDQTG